MDGLRTIIACLACLAVPAPSAAGLLDTVDLLRMFADCAGRYSAETEHGWLEKPGQGDGAQQRRDQFADLAAALEPAADARLVMGWRVAAKAAQRELLSAAAFAGNQQASRTAAAYRDACDRLLPGS